MSVRIFLLLFLVLCVHVNSYAQFPFYQYFSDSIRPGYRISGNFDSIDVRLGNYQSSLPMLNQRFALETFNTELLSNSVQNQNRPARYSSIPHVGLQYSFGSNLSQKGGISYTQALTPNQFIQLDYTRLNSNGVLRNSAYEINHVDIRHLLRKAHYASQTDIVFDGSLRKTNGGLVGDSIDPDVTLQFNAVEKEDASVTQRYFHTEWRNFFSFTGDSLLKTGVFITPRYQIENRRYEETGDILSIYGVANINAGFSNDYWERSEIGATGGYFFHTSALSVNAGFGVKYWDFDNLIRKSDTVETMLSADLAVNGPNRIRFTANGAYTLSGATGENHLAATLSWQPDFADIAVNASFKQAYPANYQRAYYANALNYSWVNRQLSTVAKANASVRLKNKWLPLIANASFSHLQHMPFFIDSNWRQDTLTAITVLRVALRADLHVKKLFFQPSVAVQQSDLKFVPVLQAGMRMGFDGFLFKAKKLRATFGAEIGYTSSFTLLDYVPMMDTYVLPASVTNRSYEAMIRLHVFSQFELGFFRWYLRVENIEQTFLKTTNQEALGYPVLPLQIRIGMSWDLFN